MKNDKFINFNQKVFTFKCHLYALTYYTKYKDNLLNYKCN